MPITLNGDTGITTPTYGGAVTAEYSVPVTSFKNRIINGAMMIDQRNAGASVTPTAIAGQYTLDRWNANNSAASKYSVQRNAGSVTPPAGYTNYLGVTSLAATTVNPGDYYQLIQYIEGLNCADLGFGTANAQTVTLSFWVRSSLTGTFGGSLNNSAENRSYPYSYTISAANTWEQKTITIAGDTTGTWLTDNGKGLTVRFSLGMGSTYSSTAGSWQAGIYASVTGSTSVVGTNGATFYITGVQLEKGSTATSFDYRPYGTELALCQRYYQINQPAVGWSITTTAVSTFMPTQVPMRASATATLLNGTSALLDFGQATRNITAISSYDSSFGQLDVVCATTTLSKSQGIRAGTISLSAEL